MSEAVLAQPRVSRLRDWLRYDESLETEVDAAFETFIRRSRIGPLFLVGVAVAYVGDIVMAIAYRNSLTAHFAAILVFTYVCMYVPALFGLFCVPKDVLLTVFRGAADFRRSVLLAVASAVSSLFVEGLVFAILSALRVPVRHQPDILAAGILLWLASAVVCAPVVEEAFFQGWVQTRLERCFPRHGLAITTVIFLLYHIPRSLGELVRGVGLWTDGLIRRETRSLGSPVIAHATYNGILALVFIPAHFMLHLPLHW